MPEDQGELRKFAVALHGRPGVAEACLVLQERAGLDVNLLIAAAWLAARRRATATGEDVARLDGHVRLWHREVVVPLRAVRRRLKSGPPPAPSEATARLRADLQAVEIAAELLELDEIEAAAARLPARAGAASGFEASGSEMSVAEAAAAGMLAVVAHFAGRPADAGEAAAVATIASAAEALACVA